MSNKYFEVKMSQEAIEEYHNRASSTVFGKAGYISTLSSETVLDVITETQEQVLLREQNKGKQVGWVYKHDVIWLPMSFSQQVKRLIVKSQLSMKPRLLYRY